MGWQSIMATLSDMVTLYNDDTDGHCNARHRSTWRGDNIIIMKTLSDMVTLYNDDTDAHCDVLYEGTWQQYIVEFYFSRRPQELAGLQPIRSALHLLPWRRERLIRKFNLPPSCCLCGKCTFLLAISCWQHCLEHNNNNNHNINNTTNKSKHRG